MENPMAQGTIQEWNGLLSINKYLCVMPWAGEGTYEQTDEMPAFLELTFWEGKY